MLKWLAIALIVLFGFIVVLLGLGYLLQANEKSTTALKQQLDQQRFIDQQRQKKRAQSSLKPNTIEVERSISNKPSSKVTLAKNTKQTIDASLQRKPNYQQIITENLTCVSSAQCLVVSVEFSNQNCLVAINRIGAVQLAKAGKVDTHIKKCTHYINDTTVQCLTNLCTLTSK